MKTKIKWLSFEEAAFVYNSYIQKHFPKDEIKPLKNIKRMWDSRNYFAFGMFDENEGLLGYAFLCDAPASDFALLDYLAITETGRGKGNGSSFLRQISKTLEGYVGILIETEALSHAKDEREREIRSSRNRFYERNGVTGTGIKTETFGVFYDIWCLPIMETYYDETDVRESLDEIYTRLIDNEEMKEKNFRFVM